ncbi:type III effector HopG1 [Xanthomonas hyacinthi]|uniref:Type III effector HopG1 n=1 Tax=Xanthomonas hyacinthi TaxID=56455 RepID=A0A2S7ER54_9XANT|nr:hypothetical protein XhyaCFBP1156_18305 [Xanthomonas hyacinthi]QGY75627.1 type III effector HopG1 [Xanthomonas hyacinthi]
MARRAAKYAAGVAAGAYLYHKTANEFFLSTTALHDGKQGFTSDARLERAAEQAQHYHDCYIGSSPEQRLRGDQAQRPRAPRLCGENQFASMLDFRAATKVHVAQAANTAQARQSLRKTLDCVIGSRVRTDALERYGVTQRPREWDLRQSEKYDRKNGYSLSGVRNEASGSMGYVSRSITSPAVNRGANHLNRATSGTHALSPRQAMESLQAALQRADTLDPAAQFAAGQALLTFRRVYAAPENWGDSEKVILATLYAHGLVSKTEADKIEDDRPSQPGDLAKGIANRNRGVLGPILHRADMLWQERILKRDAAAIDDLKQSEDLAGVPFAHFKLNDTGSGFEDCSGWGSSFTGLNVAAYLNHARLMSGEQRLSMDEVKTIVACLNAVWDNAGSVRHTLRETAHGCFVGAGYTVEDADEFHAQVCRDAAQAFYGGKQLRRIQA